MNHIAPLGNIGQYLERYATDRANGLDEWEVFWDYRCGVHADGGSILADPHVYEASARIISYLFFYGMGRGTRLFRVRSSRRFASILRALSTPQGRELFGQQFPDVNWTAAPFTTVWNDLENALLQVAVSTTSTMRSKILLAVWGEIPALDSRFNQVFKATWAVHRRPRLPRELDLVREKYMEVWRNEIEAAPNAWKCTTGGNRIPDARLLDIAFFHHGE